MGTKVVVTSSKIKELINAVRTNSAAHGYYTLDKIPSIISTIKSTSVIPDEGSTTQTVSSDKVIVDSSLLVSIADAIRSVNGTTDKMTLDDMISNVPKQTLQIATLIKMNTWNVISSGVLTYYGTEEYEESGSKGTYIKVNGLTSLTIGINTLAESGFHSNIVKAGKVDGTISDVISGDYVTSTWNQTDMTSYTTYTYTLDGGMHLIPIVASHNDTWSSPTMQGRLYFYW